MRNLKNVIKLSVILLVCTAATCEKRESENCHTSIRFSNKTTRDLYVRSYPLFVHHPDPFDISRLPRPRKVGAGEIDNRDAMLQSFCYENSFSDTMFVYVFDAMVIRHRPWEVIARDYLVLQRYDLTLEDLQRLNWRITFPPDERMRNVKMYPPFNQE